MLKIILIIVAVLVLGAGGFVFIMMKGPDLSDYEYLQNPRITTIGATKVLEVPFQVPGEGLKEVFGFLFKNYYKLKGVPKRVSAMEPPVARYENALDAEMEAKQREDTFNNMIWKGVAAIPIPADISNGPDIQHEKLIARISEWAYGETAEILHIGPYVNEPSTIRKLKTYIAEQGYEISGLHEEVYLRGPGSLFSKPENYYTIIRYPVKRK